jgi:hypothetical protein
MEQIFSFINTKYFSVMVYDSFVPGAWRLNNKKSFTVTESGLRPELTVCNYILNMATVIDGRPSKLKA